MRQKCKEVGLQLGSLLPQWPQGGRVGRDWEVTEREGAAQAPWITEEAFVSEHECECVKVGEQMCVIVCADP